MSEEARKKALRQIPYGLYIIGVKDGTGHHAFTGSWLSQCSMKPPRVMLGVRHGTHSLDMIKHGKVFSVNWLSKEEKKTFEQFFKATPASGDRFGDLTYHRVRSGAHPRGGGPQHRHRRDRERGSAKRRAAFGDGRHALALWRLISL
jgi:flavin reductase (DIM6/NTAB) family NADH-FMN oxidoreductase RutF